MYLCRLAFAALFIASTAFAAQTRPAQARSAPPAYLTAEAAGPDFLIQGEYEGTAKQTKVGLQVIALGRGKFRLVTFDGGLPGESQARRSPDEIEATKEGETVTFTNKGDSLVVGSGKAVWKSGTGSWELPRAVRKSPAEGAKAPQGAAVLFDGSNLDAFRPGAQMNDQKLLAAGAFTKKNYQSFTLHLEFILPFMPVSTGQSRANSGVYIQNRYEIQILDSFGLKAGTGDCGALYRQVAPRLNMCFAPLQWQTYDIDFTAARWEGDKKIKNASVTVKLNGVIVQDNQEITAKTGLGAAESPAPGPILFQMHDTPVFFRNLWIVEKE
jgi:hypothetical protein